MRHGRRGRTLNMDGYQSRPPVSRFTPRVNQLRASTALPAAPGTPCPHTILLPHNGALREEEKFIPHMAGCSTVEAQAAQSRHGGPRRSRRGRASSSDRRAELLRGM